MPNTHETLSALFTDIANAIRGKTGGTTPLVADNFPAEIAGIERAEAAVQLIEQWYSLTTTEQKLPNGTAARWQERQPSPRTQFESDLWRKVGTGRLRR